MSFAGKKKLQEIHEGRPEVFPRVSKPHTTSLLITQHAMQNSECFATRKTKRQLKKTTVKGLGSWRWERWLRFLFTVEIWLSLFFLVRIYVYFSSLTILVINVIQIIRHKRSMPAYIHMTVINSKPFGYFGHCTLLNIVSTSLFLSECTFFCCNYCIVSYVFLAFCKQCPK